MRRARSKAQKYFSSMISGNYYRDSRERRGNSIHRAPRESNLRNRNNGFGEIYARNLRTTVYTVKLEQVAEPLTYAPENNLYRTTLSLFYFFLNVQSIARRFSSGGMRAYHDAKRKTEGRLKPRSVKTTCNQ